MVGGNDVRQSQTVNLHHGTTDIFQLCFADHMPVNDNSRIGIDIVNTEYCQNI